MTKINKKTDALIGPTSEQMASEDIYWGTSELNRLQQKYPTFEASSSDDVDLFTFSDRFAKLRSLQLWDRSDRVVCRTSRCSRLWYVVVRASASLLHQFV